MGAGYGKTGVTRLTPTARIRAMSEAFAEWERYAVPALAEKITDLYPDADVRLVPPTAQPSGKLAVRVAVDDSVFVDFYFSYTQRMAWWESCLGFINPDGTAPLFDPSEAFPWLEMVLSVSAQPDEVAANFVHYLHDNWQAIRSRGQQNARRYWKRVMKNAPGQPTPAPRVAPPKGAAEPWGKRAWCDPKRCACSSLSPAS